MYKYKLAIGIEKTFEAETEAGAIKLFLEWLNNNWHEIHVVSKTQIDKVTETNE